VAGLRARSALFTLFGDVIRPAGGTAWLTTITACMQALDFTPEATRTALHRMAAEGWVAPSKVGRFSAYRLTDRGVERLDEAAARIYRLRAADWDGHWHVLVCPAAGRDSAVSSALRWMGHGRLSADVWISPHRQGERLARLLDAHGLTGSSVRLDSAATSDPAENARIVDVAWDLSELRTAHQAFIDQWGDLTPPPEPQTAFVTRIRLVHHWRSFLFLDPGLPSRLLPADWLGDAAADIFRRLYAAVDDAAWTFYDELSAAAPPLDATRANGVLSGRSPGETAITARLDALQTSR
jgi:phenylacetic acid degradation operon negative regulatory protein